MLIASSLSHEYEYKLFEDVNFELKPAQSLSITGVSGCGKSTLLHICSTMLKPKCGEVFWEDKSLYKLNDKELLKIRRKEMGIIFQAHYLFKAMSARENLQISNILAKTNFDNKLLEKLKIAHVLNQNVSDLSGGQQQRVSIARVLFKKPKIIFADEPTGNLDSKTSLIVMNTIFEYIKEYNAMFILVTHDENLAKKCDFNLNLEEFTF